MTSSHFYINLKIARNSNLQYSNVINYDMNLEFVGRKRSEKHAAEKKTPMKRQRLKIMLHTHTQSRIRRNILMRITARWLQRTVYMISTAARV